MTEVEAAPRLRRLTSPSAVGLARLCEAFDDLQTVLRCCELLVGASADTAEDDAAQPDPVSSEAWWTTALLSYGRCFGPTDDPLHPPALRRADVEEAVGAAEATTWHDLLMQLRAHHAHLTTNPREHVTVTAVQGGDGRAEGVAVTSRHEPSVDEATVRRTGAVAYALGGLLDRRIEEEQRALWGSVETMDAASLDQLEPVEVGPDPDPGPDEPATASSPS